MKKRNFFVLSIAALMALVACGPAASSEESKANSENSPTSGQPSASEVSQGDSTVSASSEESKPATSFEPKEVKDVNVAFNEVTDNCMVSPKVKTYVDAMKQQELTLEKPYRITPLYGPEDFGKNKSDTNDGATYQPEETGGVDVCELLNRNDYGNKIENYPIKLSWAKGDLNYTSAKLKFWSKDDKSDLREVAVSGTEASLPNLFRATKYKYQLVTDVTSADDTQFVSQEGEFTTGDYPRTITMGRIANVRDIGGYMTSYGVRTNQGLIYRGYEIIDQGFTAGMNSHSANYDEACEKVNLEVMNIKHEIDLKDDSGRNGRTASCLTTSDYQGLEVVAYDGFLTSDITITNLPTIFATIAKSATEHVYFHCWGGADRTGMIAFFVNAILGVSYTDLIIDFELTTETNNKRCHMHNSSNAHFPKFLGAFTALDSYDETKTVNENCEAWLLSKGVKAEDIENIRKAMLPGYTSEMKAQEPTYTANTSVWAGDDLAHWHAANEDANVRCDYHRHSFVVDATKTVEANCAHEGLEVKSCSDCGKEVRVQTPKTDHIFKDDGKDGLVYKELDDGCNTHAYKFKVTEATGWNKETKMNGRTSPDNQASWAITGIPAGTYEVQLSCKMSYSSHSSRYFYNMTKRGNEVDSQNPDKTSESDYRYWVQVDNGAESYPLVEKNWGELGLSATDFKFVNIEATVTITDSSQVFKLIHGDIGFSLAINWVRLVEVKAE